MKIYSMTATFGKLDHETLTLQPGLNIIEAPNEWGKSTWCAFIVAMLYGIETRPHSTKTALADKERYAPWSGAPMSGRIDLNWNGRDITIERRSKGRSVFSDFYAYETATGIPVSELTAANCGQTLLGVERSVFQRSAFLRLNDLPVTQDEALRRRLNALVTTGDESGAADDLEKKLKDLKNRCRFHRTGLLPQAEAEKAELEEKLHTVEALQEQYIRAKQQLEAVEENIAKLENHRDALEYEAALETARRLEKAAAAEEAAAIALRQAEAAAGDADWETAQEKLQQLRLLQEQQAYLEREAQILVRPARETPAAFAGVSADAAYDAARQDAARWATSKRLRLPGLLALAALIAMGAGGFFLWKGYWIPAAVGVCMGAGLLAAALIRMLVQRKRAKRIERKYGAKNPSVWLALARQYAEDCRFAEDYDASVRSLQRQKADLAGRIAACTGGMPLPQAAEQWQQAVSFHKACEDARQAYLQAQNYRAAIEALVKPALPPKQADPLTDTLPQTEKQLLEYTMRHRQLQLKLGQCMGQLEQLGSRGQYANKLSALQARIGKLEDTYAAAGIALQTLQDAKQQLQRRFAPRIAKRAQVLFGKLTGQRYDRLTLGEDMQLHAGAQDEDTLHSSLWRSEGTVDQLYLALRLAVAGELIPDAPLVLDDALVRFDDARLAAAMEILKEEAQTRQVILFTCQGREKMYCDKQIQIQKNAPGL